MGLGCCYNIEIDLLALFNWLPASSWAPPSWTLNIVSVLDYFYCFLKIRRQLSLILYLLLAIYISSIGKMHLLKSLILENFKEKEKDLNEFFFGEIQNYEMFRTVDKSFLFFRLLSIQHRNFGRFCNVSIGQSYRTN